MFEITAADVVAAVTLGALIVYVLFGGADFGAGVVEIFTFGPSKNRQRAVIEQAVAPIWEANHVWLILVIVLLFSCFPLAFSVIMTSLHIPMALMLLGIVFRGTVFTFRHYDPDQAETRLWGRVFAVSCVITPIFLGVGLASLSTGGIRVIDDVPVTGFVTPWLGWFQLFTGLFTVALFAFLASVYLTNETSERDLLDAFRARAMAFGVAAIIVGAIAMLAMPSGSGQAMASFADRFHSSWWSWPVKLFAAVSMTGALLSLHYRRFVSARAFAVATVVVVILAWGLAQYPFMVWPDVTVESAAAPRVTILLILGTLAVGSLVLLPALYFLLKVFKFSKK